MLMSGNRKVRGLRAALASVMSSCLLIGCATNPKDVTGITVSGSRDQINVNWNQGHPWAGHFQSNPGRFRLFAQYRSGDKNVEQEIAAATLNESGGWTFKLPDALRQKADSQVCLLISERRSAQGIPVRGAVGDRDTARFRYEEWEKLVLVRTNSKQDAQLVGQLESNLQRVSELLSIEKARLPGGVRTVSDCERAVKTEFDSNSQSRPKDVVDMARLDSVSEKVCVRRARNMRIYSGKGLSVDMAAQVSNYLKATSDKSSDRLRNAAIKFAEHWNRWFDSAGVEYVPEVGSSQDGLPVVGVVRSEIFRWNQSKEFQSSARADFIVAGLLEAYDGCLQDVRKQLVIKRDSWERAHEYQPLRDKKYAEKKVSECAAQVARVDSIARDVEDLKLRLDAKRQDLAKRSYRLPDYASGSFSLNGNACSL